MKIPLYSKEHAFFSLLLTLSLSLSAGSGPSRNATDPCTGLRDMILNNHDDELLKLTMEERQSLSLLEDDEVIHWAAACGHMKSLQWISSDIIKFDLRHLVNKVDCFGDTPLHKAAFMGHIEVIHFLISFGVDITIRNDYGYNAYNLAVQEGHKEVARLLRDEIRLKNPDDSCLCLPRQNTRYNNKINPLEEIEGEDTFLLKALEVIDALSMYTWQQRIPEFHHNEKLLKQRIATRTEQLNTLMDFEEIEEKVRKGDELKGLPLRAKINFCHCANRYLDPFSTKWHNCLPSMTKDEYRIRFKKSDGRSDRYYALNQ